MNKGKEALRPLCKGKAKTEEEAIRRILIFSRILEKKLDGHSGIGHWLYESNHKHYPLGCISEFRDLFESNSLVILSAYRFYDEYRIFFKKDNDVFYPGEMIYLPDDFFSCNIRKLVKRYFKIYASREVKILKKRISGNNRRISELNGENKNYRRIIRGIKRKLII